MEEMITIPRSEYEQMKLDVVELQAIVQQLKATIALMKGGNNSYILTLKLFMPMVKN